MKRDIGRETLKRISSMRNYNSWIYERLKPFVGKRVLEVGCGIGNMTQFFKNKEFVMGVDIDAKQISMIKQAFKGKKNMRFQVMDIEKANPKKFAKHRFDTIICLNVLEHIANDQRALKKFHDMLAPGGKLLLQVPAYPMLYSTLDKNILHFRRYTRKSLLRKASKAGFRTKKCNYMNIFGIPGWFLNGRILRRQILPEEQLRGFDKFLPILKRVDRLFNYFGGLSIIYAGQKP